eukprot:3533690-Rhodomonas_salina.1
MAGIITCPQGVSLVHGLEELAHVPGLRMHRAPDRRSGLQHRPGHGRAEPRHSGGSVSRRSTPRCQRIA